MKRFLWEAAATNATSSFHLLHSGEISRREKQILFCFFFKEMIEGLTRQNLSLQQQALREIFVNHVSLLSLCTSSDGVFTTCFSATAANESCGWQSAVCREIIWFILPFWKWHFYSTASNLFAFFFFFLQCLMQELQPCFYLPLHFNRKWQRKKMNMKMRTNYNLPESQTSAHHGIHFQLMTAVTTFWNPVIKINSYIFWLHLSNQSKDIISVLQHPLTDKWHQIKGVSCLSTNQQDVYLF